MRKIILVVSAVLWISSALAEGPQPARRPLQDPNDPKQYEETGGVRMMAPSVHIAGGIRSKKAPDLDTYYSAIGGVKFSLFSVQFGENMYISFLVPGLQYAGFGVFAPSATPLIFNHISGIGIALDLFPVRKDRAGGPLGMSLNIDIPRLVSFASKYVP